MIFSIKYQLLKDNIIEETFELKNRHDFIWESSNKINLIFCKYRGSFIIESKNLVFIKPNFSDLLHESYLSTYLGKYILRAIK